MSTEFDKEIVLKKKLEIGKNLIKSSIKWEDYFIVKVLKLLWPIVEIDVLKNRIVIIKKARP